MKDGRNAPELDLIEAQIDTSVMRGEVSQSYQTAPFNYQYDFDNSTTSSPIFDPTVTKWNSYKGGQYQQALSAVSYVDSDNYGGNNYAVYSFEWWSNPKNREEGYVQWSSEGSPTWKITAASLAGDTQTGISSRIMPEEPMVSVWSNIGFKDR